MRINKQIIDNVIELAEREFDVGIDNVDSIQESLLEIEEYRLVARELFDYLSVIRYNELLNLKALILLGKEMIETRDPFDKETPITKCNKYLKQLKSQYPNDNDRQLAVESIVSEDLLTDFLNAAVSALNL